MASGSGGQQKVHDATKRLPDECTIVKMFVSYSLSLPPRVPPAPIVTKAVTPFYNASSNMLICYMYSPRALRHELHTSAYSACQRGVLSRSADKRKEHLCPPNIRALVMPGKEDGKAANRITRATEGEARGRGKERGGQSDSIDLGLSEMGRQNSKDADLT